MNRILAGGEGRLWLATGLVVYIFADGRFTTIDGRVTATSVELDDSGTLWIGTTTGLMKIDRNKRHLSPTTAQDLEGITALYPDDGGNLWPGTTRW